MPTPLDAIRIPRSTTAVMQLLQLYAQHGHFYWTSGEVEQVKLTRFADKLAALRISRDAPGRAYDKKRGLASSHLVVLPQSDGSRVAWSLVSTSGARGLADPSSLTIGEVKDMRRSDQHLRWGHYELLRAEKRIGKVRETTWTWRLSPERYRELEALIVERAKQRDALALTRAVAYFASMPQFSGVRGQVLRLFHQVRKLSAKFGMPSPEMPVLPYMVRLPVYDVPARRLSDLAR